MSEPDAAGWEQGSPFGGLIGMSLAEWRRDFARVELRIAPQLLNSQGVPHGGVYATLLDSCMGYAGCYTGDPGVRQRCLTLNLSVNFLSRSEHPHFIAEGCRTGGGRRTFFAEGRVSDGDGVLLATATGVFRYRD